MGTNITGIGNANAIGFKSRVTGGAYFPPELKDALVGVWLAYGKSNDSTDRNIIKNKIKDRGGDFVISNAAYEGMSGYNGYPVVFGANKTWDQMPTGTFTWNIEDNKLHITKALIAGNGLLFSYVKLNGSLLNVKEIPSFKIKVSGLEGKSKLWYRYLKTEDAISETIAVLENGTHELPKSYIPSDSLHNGVWVGFTVTPISEGVKEFDCDITIEVLPEYEGAFVTDGVDDLITSTKTVQEMGITDEITVVSMIHKISSDNNWTNLIGELKEDHTFVANRATNTDKTGIYGYTYNYVGDAIVINNILGDKNDYIVRTSTSLGLDNKYYVTGFRSAGIIQNISQIAWYWTFIANRVLTEDEINLVIEKYNLDRPGEIVKPDVYYDIKRQKITNENHSAFDDKLIDYSGNGYDAKLYNFGWKEDSGIGKYETDFTDWKKSFKVTSFDSESIKFTSDVSWVLLYHPSSIGEDIPSFKVRIKLYGKGTLYYNYITQEGKYTNVAVKSEIFETPICYNTKYTGEKGVNVGFTLGVISGECSGTITQIPEYKDALIFDGIDDYGKVTGLPILKDYTVAADYIRTFAKENAQDSPILSKSKVAGSGAFLFNYLNADSVTSSYSFGTNNILKEINDSERKIYYLSKYASDGHNVNAGSAVDYDTMWLGTYRDNISNFFTGALYFAMLFPYSLSEFLLERQIKKARAGTLYPNQVEFRPVIPEDENITRIDYFVVNSGTWIVIKPGDYVDVGARIVFNVYTKLPYKVEKVSSPAFTGMSVRHSTELNIFDVEGYIKDKTPQKIKLTLAVNEDIVQWNPTITSNLLDSFTASSWYLNGWDNTLTEGTWIKKTDRVFFKATFKTELYGLETATFGGAECVVSKADNWSDSTNIWDIRMLGTVGDLSQVFNLDVYELIRFEDIVQPYPSFYEFIDENKNLITWGSKIKIGSTITRIKGFFDSNLLKGLYTISYPKLNGVEASGSKYVVEKSMVFTCTATWIFDNNEPKCVLSPDRLQIPNSSYRILKHIPDISGHGNHGKINNSAYAEMSGANGYPYNYNNEEFAIQPGSEIINDTTFIIHKLVPNVGMVKNTPLYKGKIKITGLNDKLALYVYAKGYLDSEIINSYKIYKDGIYDINIVEVTEVIYFHVVSLIDDVQNRDVNVTIQQIGEYEGSFCLDGVDDFVTIPTLVTKQSLIKCNWTTQNYNKFLVDHRKDNASNGYSTNKTGSTDIQLAYNGRVTYIDGILNKNLIPDDNLKEITHCATIQYPNNVESETTIASAFDLRGYMQMALYTYIAFSEFSTEEKIKELNEYVGTEGNIVEWNPTITSNIPYKDISTYITTDGTTDLSPKVGNLYKKGDKLTIGIKPAKDLDEVGTVTINGVKIKRSSLTELGYYIYDTVLDSTQIIDITIDEYIKYEDIVQPFPTIFELKNIDTNVTYTYGSKLKIGSEFLFDKWTNLLPELYRPTGSGRYNGNEFKTGNTYTVERTMTFSWSSPMEYLLSSAPKCIFSPSKLRMPNESYRYLGYIPDISGNGNNGVFNNFAFSKMSGVNGYLEDFTTLRDYGIKGIVRTDSKIYLDESFDYDKGFWLGYTNVPSPAYKVKISGIPETGMLTYTGGVWLNLTNGINELPARTNTAENHGFVVQSPNLDWSNLVIEQIPEYEGSICFDGVNDYITIPTLSEGGKQVLMKVNWQKQDTMLYNQNPGQDNFAIFTNDYNNNNLVVAYASRNNGNTYIDGVVNNNILATQLKGITHNIVATNNNIDATITPIIGSNKNHDNFFAQMALYDFMLFDEISTDEEIKELNNIVGIEGDYVQKPSYYWDAYGKSNLDVDKGYIKDQVSLQLNNDTTNNNSLENFNFGYEGMSGYNGYPVIFGANKTWKNKAPEGPNSYICTINANKYNITQILLSNAWTYSYIKENGELTKYNKDVGSFKIKVTGLKSEIPLRYSYLSSTDATVTSNITIKSDGTYELPKSFANDGSLIDNYGWIGFSFTKVSVDIPEIITDVNITIEILPEYKNGLVYDGVDDYSENASIPLLSDYTYIFKRTLLNKKYNSASIFKGSNQQSGGGAFICDYNSVEPDLLTQGYSFGAGLYVDSLNADSIVYGTRGSVNGTKITAGNNTDTEGLTVGKWRAYKEMVFYKLFLYPRTVNMLSINMVKNMMEEDGIIDLTSKLFTDKYTGDFYEMDFNNDFLIGN